MMSTPHTPLCTKSRKRTRSSVTPKPKNKNVRQQRSTTTLSPGNTVRDNNAHALLYIASHLHEAGLHDEKMRHRSQNLSLLTDTSIAFPSEKVLCTAPSPQLDTHAGLDVLSALAASPPKSPKIVSTLIHRTTPARRRKGKGRYQHQGVSGAPVAFAHADSYAYVWANLARGGRVQASPSTEHPAEVQQPAIETDGGGDGTQLVLELEEVMDQLCGMVEFHHCTAGTTTATLREDYTQNCRFHQQYHAHRDSGELNSSS